MFSEDNWLLDFNIKKPFYFNPKHKEFYNCIKHKDTKIAFVDGPAGSMKTYIAVYAGLELIKREKQFSRLVYIRSIAESAEKSLGSLPGEIDDKFSPYAIPLLEKVIEITNQGTCIKPETKRYY
jgi:PhoH-like ATPase